MASGPKRFLILSAPRTGSTLVQQALDSSPEIVCFGEIFNQHLDFIDYHSTNGYESNDQEIASRADDPAGFLEQRIFSNQPPSGRATGFKLHYDHFWGFPGLVEALRDDHDLAVIHLRRRNALRSLVSSKIVEETGVYFESAGSRSGPIAAIARTVRRAVPGRRQRARATVEISQDELRKFVVVEELTARHWEGEVFRDHELQNVQYEDLVADPSREFARIQSFLGVEPRDLAIRTARQNPQPLSVLIENYAELSEACRGTDLEWMLDG